jgi:hypothetical protein
MAQVKKVIAKATYDFATDGGAVGAITPAINAQIPDNAIITSAWTDVRTNMTSGGSATVALAAGGVTIKAATAFDDGAYTGLDMHINNAPAKCSASGNITFTVATAALTAGVVDIYVEYLQSV